MIPEEHLPDHYEFFQAVSARKTPFTYYFFGFNILIFVLMALAGGSTNEPTLMAFGVKANEEIARGQWWRFITPIFIHIGLLHLAFNSYALWIIGPQVEKLYGSARFVILYILAGVAGVYGSYYYHPFVQSAGASGAIFGLLGVMLVFGIRYRNSIPPALKRGMVNGVLQTIVLNLIIGFSIAAVDNAAHIGGLLGGALLAGVVPFQKPREETARVFEVIQISLLALVAVCFFAVFRNYDGPQLSVRNLGRGFTQILSSGSSTTQDFIDAINTAQKTFEDSADDLENGRKDKLASLKANTTKSIDQLRKMPSLAPEADQLTSRLLRVMQDQYELIQDVERSATITFAHSRQLKENVANYEKVMKDFSNWVQTDGQRHGIQMGKER